MAVVVTMDQRGSSSSEDLVDSWSNKLNDEFHSAMRLPFARTAGDEMQALLTDSDALLELVLPSLDSGTWWVGIGLGGPNLLGDTARDSRGPAFTSARAAVEEAKRRPWRCSVQGDPSWAAAALDGCIAMLERIRTDRTERASELVALALSGARQSEIAERLGISRQAVSKQLRRAGLEEEKLGRKAAVELLKSVT
jgi:hypothetical protein